jgi:hypothetical protein
MKQAVALKIIQKWMNEIRKEYDNEEDPFKTTKVLPKTRMATEYIKKVEGNLEYAFTDWKLVPDTGVITLMYDGDGYDYLSYESDYGRVFREDLDKRLKKAGFHIEDTFSWASEITED